MCSQNAAAESDSESCTSNKKGIFSSVYSKHFRQESQGSQKTMEKMGSTQQTELGREEKEIGEVILYLYVESY